MKMRTQVVLLAACIGIVICFAQADESSDRCNFSDLDVEKMVDHSLRLPTSYSKPSDEPVEIIQGITMGPPVIKGLDKLEPYGAMLRYCRNGAQLVQVDLVNEYPIELSATWKTCGGQEGVIGTFGTTRFTLIFEVVNAIGEDKLQEKGKKLVLHSGPNIVDVNVVSVYLRGAGELLGNIVAASRLVLPALPTELLRGFIAFEVKALLKNLTERP